MVSPAAGLTAIKTIPTIELILIVGMVLYIDNEFYVIQILESFYVEFIIFPVIFDGQTPMCLNDMLAEEIYHDLSQKGIRIPQDLSIVGFDNQNIKLDGDCYLTSVQHPRRKLGETAANLVCDMIEQGCNVAPVEPIIMPSTIVVRNSIMNKRFRL